MNTRFEIALQAAAAASEIIREGFARLAEIDVKEKSPGDVATEVDARAEAAIQHVIWRNFACDIILGEESGEHVGPAVSPTMSESGYRWIVDPLDGTFNFVHGFPHCGVSIALEHAGEIMAAVVANPFNNEIFSAQKGEGAFLNGTRLRVSVRTQLADALVGVVLPSARSTLFPTVWKKVEAVAHASGQIRRTGSAALDMAYVAAGRLDAFFVMSLRKWDIAAGALLVTEAGGTVTDIRGGNDHLREENCAAGNAALVALLVRALNYEG